MKNLNWGQWFYGLVTGVVSAFCTGAAGALALPTVFTLDRNGFANMVKLGVPSAIIAFLAYLKDHPAPVLKATVDPAGNVKVEGNPVVEMEVEGKKTTP